MIDVILDGNGELAIAHDREDLPRVQSIQISAVTRQVKAFHPDRPYSRVGRLVPSVHQDALTCKRGRVIVLSGFDIVEQYQCDLDIVEAA